MTVAVIFDEQESAMLSHTAKEKKGRAAHCDAARNAMVATAVLLCLTMGGSAAYSQDPARRLAETSSSTPDDWVLLPGWITDNSITWTANRAAYKQKCANIDVVEEIKFLNTLYDYDHKMIAMTRKPETGNGAKLNTLEIGGKLRSDVATIDVLIGRLQALPACAEAAQPAAGASAAPDQVLAPKPSPAELQPTTEQDKPVPSPAASAAPAAESVPRAGSKAEPQSFVVRFDDRMPALTPTSVRILGEAVTGLRRGEVVQLAIDGCDAAAAKTFNSVCARRLLSLKELLAARGVSRPSRLLAAYQ